MDYVEFPVFVEEENITFTLIVTEEQRERAINDNNYLSELLDKTRGKAESGSTAIDKPGPSNETGMEISASKDDEKETFNWPDKCVYELLNLYETKQEDFTCAGRRNARVWEKIAEEVKNTFPMLRVTGQQCSSKLAGLKRTYKHIKDSNGKSGNSRVSWQFFPILDSIFGQKPYIKPLAIASSDGPPSCDRQEINSGHSGKKSKRKTAVEQQLEELRKDKERRHQERQEERKKRHEEKVQIQSRLVELLEKVVDKK